MACGDGSVDASWRPISSDDERGAERRSKRSAACYTDSGPAGASQCRAARCAGFSATGGIQRRALRRAARGPAGGAEFGQWRAWLRNERCSILHRGRLSSRSSRGRRRQQLPCGGGLSRYLGTALRLAYLFMFQAGKPSTDTRACGKDRDPRRPGRIRRHAFKTRPKLCTTSERQLTF